MDKPVIATTNAKGIARFVHDGLACVGAVAFLTDNASKGTKVLDKTKGILTNSVIPVP